MKRPWRLVGWLVGLGVLAILAEVGFFAVGALGLPPPAPSPPRPTQLRGAYHVHSRLSDGRGTPDEIAAAAAAAGLQFVVLTDHNLVELPPPRISSGVLLVFQTELSTPSGHVVALDLGRGLSEPDRREGVLAKIHRQEGAAFISHPVQRKSPWKAFSPSLAPESRIDGMELYSGDSLFREALEHPGDILFPALGTFLVRPAWGLWSLARESPRTRARLMELSADHRVTGICANDAHGWPGYESAFRALSLYLTLDAPLSPQPAEAARQVTRALRQGAFHCGFGDWASADGFAIQGELDAERQAPVGAELALLLPAAPPSQTRVDVHGAGRWDAARQRVVLTGPGPLWVEIWVQPEGGFALPAWRPWIVSSPIRVVSRQAGESGE